MRVDMKAEVSSVGKLAFKGVSGSGHEVILDGDKERGASPMEYVLLGIGGCSSIDVTMIMEKMRQDVKEVRCQVTAQRADDDPKVFTAIHIHYIVTGTGIDPAKAARAIELSATKYCSVSIMLQKAATITHDFEVVAA